MPIDVNTLSVRELDQLINQAKKRKTTLAKRKPIALVRRKLTQLAKAEGYRIDELFGGKAPASTGEAKPASKARKGKGKPTGKVAPKYRNPANPAETWAGRGQAPRWLAAELKSGKTLEDFLIR
ncbi:H-NS family nucleoid-associated regulatory protein [Cognatiluteimonas telluris]|jgi:DNA-binding protein H-NS|uniref:H-NS histone family protein n=1 Tax=Cognatiluteimonas telluris TaxID=1104775 RepID=UPI00140B8A09|nr:H-NS histone family protein [Lysobacter telluris]